MQSHIQQGEPVLNYTHSVIEAASLSGESVLLSAEEQWYIERKLYDGYFAFDSGGFRGGSFGSYEPPSALSAHVPTKGGVAPSGRVRQ